MLKSTRSSADRFVKLCAFRSRMSSSSTPWMRNCDQLVDLDAAVAGVAHLLDVGRRHAVDAHLDEVVDRQVLVAQVVTCP